MTTKKIIWRLKEQPTSEMLRELVKDSILTKDEAREILFNLEEQVDRDIESFKAEIKFLRELVEKLANNQKVIEVVREIEKPYYPKSPWYNPYYIWSTHTPDLNCGTTYSFSSIQTF